MNRKVDKIVLGLFRPVNPHVSLILGFLSVSWGIWLLMPWSTFESAPLFDVMKACAPEWVWGTVALATGTGVVTSVVKGSYKWLHLSLMPASWYWGITALFMWMGDWQNTGGLTYSFIALYGAYLQVNINFNHIKYGSGNDSLNE